MFTSCCLRGPTYPDCARKRRAALDTSLFFILHHHMLCFPKKGKKKALPANESCNHTIPQQFGPLLNGSGPASSSLKAFDLMRDPSKKTAVLSFWLTPIDDPLVSTSSTKKRRKTRYVTRRGSHWGVGDAESFLRAFQSFRSPGSAERGTGETTCTIMQKSSALYVPS